MARTAMATATAIQVDLRLMYRINGYGGGRRQTIFAGLYTAIPAEAGIQGSTLPRRSGSRPSPG